MTNRSRHQTLATAYHEAGHAAMNWQLGMPIKNVTIVPDKESAGCCVSAKNFLRFKNGELDTSPRAQVNTQKKIMALLAGPIAQRTYRKSSFRNYHAGSDWRTAVDLAITVNGSGEIATAWLKWLELRTRGSVKFLWPRIAAVADALMEKQTLSGAEVDAICLNARRTQR
jgi:hypothetical protein